MMRCNHVKKSRDRKKKGFTLTELIAVMAIIAILATAMVPKVVGYIEEGKKTDAKEEARQIVMAVDSYNMTVTNKANKIAENAEYKDFVDKIDGKKYIDKTEIDHVAEANTYTELKSIVKGTKDFSLEDEKIKVSG